jgi:hypothetical protein
MGRLLRNLIKKLNKKRGWNYLSARLWILRLWSLFWGPLLIMVLCFYRRTLLHAPLCLKKTRLTEGRLNIFKPLFTVVVRVDTILVGPNVHRAVQP